MTTNEIKTLIENTIAGQGSQVDIGGKLSEILVSIVDAIPAETPRPIVLTAPPVEGDTLETLAEKGLTPDEIRAASHGLRTGVVIDVSFFPISAAVIGIRDFTFRFGSVAYDGTGVVDSLTQYSISSSSGSVSIAVVDF